jgi:hypothetical protein
MGERKRASPLMTLLTARIEFSGPCTLVNCHHDEPSRYLKNTNVSVEEAREVSFTCFDDEQ